MKTLKLSDHSNQ